MFSRWLESYDQKMNKTKLQGFCCCRSIDEIQSNSRVDIIYAFPDFAQNIEMWLVKIVASKNISIFHADTGNKFIWYMFMWTIDE